jgi:hypothetical protein
MSRRLSDNEEWLNGALSSWCGVVAMFPALMFSETLGLWWCLAIPVGVMAGAFFLIRAALKRGWMR